MLTIFTVGGVLHFEREDKSSGWTLKDLYSASWSRFFEIFFVTETVHPVNKNKIKTAIHNTINPLNPFSVTPGLSVIVSFLAGTHNWLK
jgi:hypothetical protein